LGRCSLLPQQYKSKYECCSLPGMMKRTTPDNPNSDPRDRQPADEAPETPTDEPKPVPVQDPPVNEPKAPYTVTKEEIVDGRSPNAP
jgi:hypothetical protein